MVNKHIPKSYLIIDWERRNFSNTVLPALRRFVKSSVTAKHKVKLSARHFALTLITQACGPGIAPQREWKVNKKKADLFELAVPPSINPENT